MSVEDWNGTPFQVVVTWASGEREAYTFEAKKRDTLKKAMLDVLNADTGSFSAVWNRVCKTLDARVDERGLQPDREGFTVSVDLNVDGSTPYVHGLAVVWGGAARYVRLPLFLRAEARPAFRLPEMVCRLLFQVA